MAEIKQAKFIDQTGQEKDAVFIGAEKAIYDDSGKRLDQKLEEREKATGLLASDTQGILGSIGTEVSLQTIIDKLAEKIMRELVSNSSLTQTLANYMTTAMMSGEQIDDGNKVPTSALAFAMNQAITQNKNAITQLNSEFGTKSINLRDKLNQNIVNNDDYPSICIAYKSGKVVTLVLFVNTKTLTGLEQILPPGALPAEYRPSRSLTFCLSGRNVGGWASATYVIGALRIATDGSSELATGTQKDNAKFIDSTFTYIAN